MIYPRISVIVVAYNEENYIRQCIESLLDQTYKGEIEILVIDGDSEDTTCEIVQSLQKNHANIKLLKNHQTIQACGRNVGLEYSTTELVAYLDGHSYASPDWLAELFTAYAEIVHVDPYLAGVGSIHLDASRSEFTLATTAAFNSFLGGSMQSSYSGKSDLEKVDTAYACLYNREALMLTGYYNTSFVKGEDLELNLRLTKKFKYNLYVSPLAKTFYYKRENMKDLTNQMRAYGYWRYRVMRHLKLFSIPVFVPSGFIVFLFLLFCLSFVDITFAKVLVFVVVFYLSTIAMESLFQNMKTKCRIIYIFKIFLVIHFGYGWGMIRSILDFRKP